MLRVRQIPLSCKARFKVNLREDSKILGVGDVNGMAVVWVHENTQPDYDELISPTTLFYCIENDDVVPEMAQYLGTILIKPTSTVLHFYRHPYQAV